VRFSPPEKRITETECRVGPLLAMGRVAQGTAKANEMTQEET